MFSLLVKPPGSKWVVSRNLPQYWTTGRGPEVENIAGCRIWGSPGLLCVGYEFRYILPAGVRHRRSFPYLSKFAVGRFDAHSC